MSTPKSMYDLGGEWLALMHASEPLFDAETGEEIDSDSSLDAAFAALGEDVTAKLAGCGHVLRRLKADAAQVADEEKRLRARRASIDASRERLEVRVRDLMDLTSTASVKTPTISVSLAKTAPRRPEVFDDALLPDLFRAPPKPGAPILKSIKLAIEGGAEVPGARLVDGKRRLTVR